MRLKNYACFILIVCAFTSCVEKKYFVNPGYGNAMPYHTLPLNTDTNKNGLYLNASLMTGSSNYDYSDGQYALNANIYNANTFSNIKIWYGAGLTLGIYDINNDDDYYADSTTLFINNNAGNKFYGSINGNAGIAYALQLGNVEWRILGVQATAQQEFGDYVTFRNKLANSKLFVEGNVTDKFLLTTGFSTEVCIKIPNGSFNIFQQYNVLTGKHYKYFADKYDDNNNSYLKAYRYSYISSTYSATIKNMTYFLQQNVDPFFSGSVDRPRLFNIQAGINYRFPVHKKK